jgi:hypothetical protein
LRLIRRIIASRIDGKRSRGPKIEAGNHRSYIKSMRHGPQRTHIEEMVTAIGKMRRLWAVETGLSGNTAATRPETTTIGPLTAAFSDLSWQPELPLRLRSEARFHHRSLRHFFAFPELPGSPTHLDPNKPNAIIDVEADSSARETLDCQTNLDPNKPNIISSMEPHSSMQPRAAVENSFMPANARRSSSRSHSWQAFFRGTLQPFLCRSSSVNIFSIPSFCWRTAR